MQCGNYFLVILGTFVQKDSSWIALSLITFFFDFVCVSVGVIWEKAQKSGVLHNGGLFMFMHKTIPKGCEIDFSLIDKISVVSLEVPRAYL